MGEGRAAEPNRERGVVRIIQRTGPRSWRVLRDDERAALKRERDHYRNALLVIAGHLPPRPDEGHPCRWAQRTAQEALLRTEPSGRERSGS